MGREYHGHNQINNTSESKSPNNVVVTIFRFEFANLLKSDDLP